MNFSSFFFLFLFLGEYDTLIIMKGAPRSDQFDDVYFSLEDGLAETRHIFMQGNGLPEFWQEKPTFTIAETGFGTGLNFLCAWKEFVETADPSQRLDFISFEKFPLSPEEITEALKPWGEELGAYTGKLIESYPIRIGGFHRIVFDGRVALTLIIGDMNEYIPEAEASVDCWFLDGFTPAKNPDMWSDTLFENMARLSTSNARFATFTAARDVGDGLKNVGFEVGKVNGFGHKRNMFVGHYIGADEDASQMRDLPKKIAIIGGGLAGTACAYALKQYGFVPVIYEASDKLASGASGNSIGLFNTRFAALRDAESEFYNSAFAQVIRMAKQADAIEFNSSGTLHLLNKEDKEKRATKMLENWHWHDDHLRLLSKEEASEVAGIPLEQAALYLPNSGSLCPEKLCAYYARDIEVHLNHKVDDLNDLDADAIILANAIDAKEMLDEVFEEVDGLPVYTVRGQVSYVAATTTTKKVKTNVCYGGYFSAAVNGVHAVGSTFQKWLKETDVVEEDDIENVDYLKQNVSSLSGEGFDVTGARAGMRLSSQDHFPIVGKVPSMDNVYTSIAFGSHGIVGSIAAGHLLADMLRGGAYSLPKRAIQKLSGERFIARARKRSDKRCDWAIGKKNENIS